MDDFKKRNTSGMNYLRDKMASASIKMGLSGGDIPDIDIAVMKGTNHDRLPPKEKHYQTIKFACARGNRQEMLYTVNQLAEVLRKEDEWVRVLKTLVIFHRLMRELDQAFTDELVNYIDKTRQKGLLNMDNFKDAASTDAWDFSAFIRVYSKYLDERTEAARPPLKYDPEHEVAQKSSSLRTMDTPELLENLPKVMRLLSALLGVLPAGQAAYDGAVHIALLMVIKESFKIYKTIQEGVLNLLDRFFEMNQVDASRALQVYKDFVLLFDRLNGYYRSCKQLMPSGVAFPDLTPLPSDLFQQMQEYVKEVKGPVEDMGPRYAPGGKPLTNKLEGKISLAPPPKIAAAPPPEPVPVAAAAPAAAPAPHPMMMDLLGDLDGFGGAGPSQPAPAAPAAAAPGPSGGLMDDPFAAFNAAAPPPPPPPSYSTAATVFPPPAPAPAYAPVRAPAPVPASFPVAPAPAPVPVHYPPPAPAPAPAPTPVAAALYPPAQPAYTPQRPGSLAYELGPPPPGAPPAPVDPFAIIAPVEQPKSAAAAQAPTAASSNPFGGAFEAFPPAQQAQQPAARGSVPAGYPGPKTSPTAARPTAVDPFAGAIPGIRNPPQAAAAPMGMRVAKPADPAAAGANPFGGDPFGQDPFAAKRY